MNRLIVPNHALGQTQLEKDVATARNTLVLGFTFLPPGSQHPCEAKLHEPCPVESIAAAVVAICVQHITQQRGKEVADKLVPKVVIGSSRSGKAN